MEYKINNFSGGLSDSDKIGVKGSFAEGVGLDIHSSPGILKCNQKLKKESGTTVTDFPRFSVACSDGNSYWFGDTGKIYKRTSAGVWSLAHTATEIKGACEFDDYLYYATDTALGRYGPISGTPAWTDSWQTLDSATYHPMVVQGLYLLVGNARKIATVDDSGTFTAQGTPDVTLNELPSNYEVRTMINFGIDVLIGTTVTDKYTSARIFRWDTVSPAYVSDDDIPENGINAFIPMDNYIFAQAGGSGNIYQYTGEELVLRKKIQGTYENATMEVLPDSYTTFRGLELFGVSNNSGNPCNEGVYSIGRHDNNYPLAINLEYPISEAVLTGISIGSLLTIGNNLLVAWKNSTTYGVDVIDWSNKYSATYKTLLLDGDARSFNKDFKNFVVSYKSKPTGTDIGVKAYINGGSAETISLIDDTTDNKVRGEITKTGGYIQLEIDLTASSNTAPEIEEIYLDFDLKKTL